MNRTVISIAAGCMIGFAIAPQSRAQEPAAAPKEFEVASVKPNHSGGRRVRIQMAPGGRLVAENVSLKMLIQNAFGVRDFQIVSAPDWVSSEHYDINAKAEGAATSDEMQPMIQALLADRFKMQMHRETRELPMYALVVAKNGPKLQASAADGGGPASGDAGGPGGPGAPGGANGTFGASRAGGPGSGKGALMRMGRGMLNAQQISMTMLANQLSQQLGRSVTDKTGLTGQYDIKLEWTPDDSQTQGLKETGTDTAAPIDSTGPSIFTALQEQLGLKLEKQKGPVEIIVIDHIEKATEN